MDDIEKMVDEIIAEIKTKEQFDAVGNLLKIMGKAIEVVKFEMLCAEKQGIPRDIALPRAVQWAKELTGCDFSPLLKHKITKH